jgi:hypothetical protein
MRLIDRYMREFEFVERHSRVMAATPEMVWDAIRNVSAREIRLLLPLMAIRTLRFRSSKADRPVMETALASSFLLLAENPPREIVLGTVGRFWQFNGGRDVQSLTSEDFVRFDEPGCAKAVLNFEVEAEGKNSRVTTETRIATTDPDAHRKFGRYWRLIYPGSALIRRSWLAAIQRRAER